MATASSVQHAGEVPDPEELIARAEAMIPTLKSRARGCVKERDVPP